MGRARRGRSVHGWLVLDKPVGLSATAATSAVKRLFGAAKAGHAGTLDPLASGVLPIALGEATKTSPYLVDAEKVYRFTVRWGEARDTDDTEGRITATSARRPAPGEIRAALPQFMGSIAQRPPSFSAIKLAGQRAYRLARAGAPAELAARPVTVHRLELLAAPDRDHAELRVECAKGVYVRSLARDLAIALGTVGHVMALRRERSGPFAERDAISLARLAELGHSLASGGAVSNGPADVLLACLRPIEAALDDIPALVLDGREADRLRQGRPVPVLRSDSRRIVAAAAEGATLLAAADGKPVGLIRWDGALAHPLRLFNL